MTASDSLATNNTRVFVSSAHPTSHVRPPKLYGTRCRELSWLLFSQSGCIQIFFNYNAI